MKRTLNALPAACFLLFGLLMAYGSVTMEASFSGTNEHRWVPLGISLFVCVLAVTLLISEARSGPGPDVEDIAHSNFVLLVVPCVVLLAAYAQGQIWFGYPAATLVTGILVFRLFRNSWLTSVLQSVAATLVLYVLFFRVLKLYNPPGRWLDLSLPF